METKTLKQLRAMAKARGLKAYTRLRKPALLRLLARAAPAVKKTAVRKASAKSRKKNKPAAAAGKRVAVQRRARARTAVRKSSATANMPLPAMAIPAAADEQQVESAKFAVTPPGVVFTEPAFGPDLGEDIDHLPAFHAPMLCLLPQKPGLLHGYWWLPPGMFTAQAPVTLRFGRLVGEALEIMQEFPLPEAHGRWDFRLDAMADLGAFCLQLGYYQTDGSFVSAMRRGIARIPGLYASEHTDRRWWVSDARFRAMYLRAGGHLQGAHLGWNASIGSPGAEAVSPGQLAWPGGNLGS